MAKTERVGIWMPLYIADMRESMVGKPLDWGMMYLNLLMAMWQNEGQLPNNEPYLRMASCGNKSQWLRHRTELGNMFFVTKEYWMHNDMRERLKKAQAVSQKRMEIGKKGVEARWEKDRAQKAIINNITKDGEIL